MSQPVDLEKLKQHRDALLLAEVAAWLHDLGKFTDLHIEHHTQNPSRKWSNDDAYKVVIDDQKSVIRLSQNAANLKKPDILNNVLNASSPKAADLLPSALKQNLQSLHVNLLNQNYSLAELIMLGMPGFATHQHRHQLLDGKDGWLPALLGLCHNVAHVDKEDPLGGEQSMPVLTSTAFGYEQQTFVIGDPQKSLDAQLKQLSLNFADLVSMRQQILKAFSYGLGDTRRPTNEVSLADWSAIVAALLKPALAGAILTQTTQARPEIRGWKNWREKIIDHDFHWRLLRVNFDVLGLYAKAVKISDLLGYQHAVEEACERVKQLVEEEYPLGNEIYRDTSGIYFTFPDLDLPADLAQEIRRRVEEVEPELAPRIAVTVGNGQTAAEQLKGILAKARKEAIKALKQPFDSENLSDQWERLWEKLPDKYKWEVCPVCRLRPKEEHAKHAEHEEHDEVCPHCDNRRKSRLETWKQQPDQTIWVGEIADHNDRVALLVGKIGLDDWLSGYLVQTMLVKVEENNPNDCVPKNPSPARLRRVWETCQRFWQETVRNGILSQQSNRTRKRLTPDRFNGQEGLYNGKVNSKPIDLFWQPDEKTFLTISNLQAAGEFKVGDVISLERPETKRKAEFQIQGIQDAPPPFNQYRPFLLLHTSPDQFLALVPAADALKIVEKIRDEYEKQFGKVRNRLPLFLGLIYAERKMPLMAMMDAARAMLDSSPSTVNSEQWKLASNPQPSDDGQTLTLEFENGIEWQVPHTMGDGTPDWWYPYFALDTQPDPPRTRQFKHDGKTWVHVQDLQQGDTVSVTPSRFDFLWLDTAARRFEAAYDKQGRRPARPTRPFYLEDLRRLEGVWETFSRPSDTQKKQTLEGVWATFSKLPRTQIKQTLEIIETARQRWFGAEKDRQSAADPAFRQFVADTLATAEWPKGKAWKDLSETARTNLIMAAARGELADLAELHLEILKEKTEEKE